MKLKIWVMVALCVTFVSANIEVTTKKDVEAVRQGISYIEKQKKDVLTTIKLKRYFLVKKVKKPSFFSSRAPIYNLYLASFLQKGSPFWLDDNKFVFHTSSSQWYLKKLKKKYHNKYNIDVVLYKNPDYKQKEFNLTKIDSSRLIEHLKRKIPKVLPKKSTKKEMKPKKEEKLVKKKQSDKLLKKKEKIAKILPVIQAKVVTKKETKNLQKGIAELETQVEEGVETIKLKRYFLVKLVKRPPFFSNKKPFYNLYLTAMINNGSPAWLEDTKFVFHTSSSQKYLKRLKKLYKKRYNLDLILYKNPKYKTETFVLGKMEMSKILTYLNAQIPKELVQKSVKKEMKPKKEEKLVKKKQSDKLLKKKEKIAKILPVIQAKVVTKKETKNLQKGIAELETQVEEGIETIKLKRYFLVKLVKRPPFFSNKKPFYNLYLTAMINNGSPAWLEDTKFVFHTSSSQKYLKRLKKLYKKRYNLDLILYKNPKYKTETFVLGKMEMSKILTYLNAQIPKELVQEISKSKEEQVLKEQRRKKYLKKRKIEQKKKAEKEKRLKEIKNSERKHKLAKEKKQIALKKVLLEKKKRESAKEKQRLVKEKKEVKQETVLLEEKNEVKRKRELEEKAWAAKKKKLEDEIEAFEKEKRLLAEKEKAEERRRSEMRKKEEERINKLLQEKEKAERERKKVEEKKKKIEEEVKAFEEKKRLLAEKEKAEENKRLEIRKKEKARMKKLAQEKEKAALERKREEEKKKLVQEKERAKNLKAEKKRKEEAKKWADKKKKLEEERKKAAEKAKKKDNLTSDIDKMMQETVDFKKKLERSESIKYY